MKSPRVVIFFGGVAASVLVLFLIGTAFLPRLVDSQLIKEKISLALAKKSGGTFSFRKITVLWIPRPEVVIEEAAVSFGQKARGAIRTVKIYPSIFYLLTGRLVARRAMLQEPKVKLNLPERSDAAIDLEEMEKQVRSALLRLTAELSTAHVDLSDGSAEVTVGDKPAVILENIAAQATASFGELRFGLSGRSNLCQQLRVEGKISPETLASDLEIGIQGLRLQESIAALPLQIAQYAPHGEATFKAKITSVGLRQVKASIGASAGRFVFVRHDNTASVELRRLKGAIIYERGAFQADMEEIDLGSPDVRGSAALKIAPDSFSARVNLRDLDIAEVGKLALQMAGDAEVVQKAVHTIPAGTIPEVIIQSTGHSVADMVLPKNIAFSGEIRSGKIVLPGSNLELENVSGSVRMAQSRLQADNISAKHGSMTGWNGGLKLGLEGPSAPFHLDLSVRSGAPELQSVLLKLVHDERFRNELLQVQNVEGELSGRIILGDRLDAVAPLVTISTANVSATYAPIPFPIAIRGGRLNLDQKMIKLENAQASLGRSNFAQLGVTFQRDGSRHLEIDSGTISLDLQQADALLRAFKNLPADLAKWQSASGRIELDKLTMSGSYDNPAGWVFACAGRVDQLEVAGADLPARITLSRGNFAAKQGQIELFDVAAAMSDAALNGGGRLEYRTGTPIHLNVSGTATIGAQMTEWLSRRAGLPKTMQLRSPLKIAADHFAWRAANDISFDGHVVVAGGPHLALDVMTQPERLALRKLTVDDGARRARLTLELAEDDLDVSFNGDLTQETIDRIFASFPVKSGSLKGGIEIKAALAKPITAAARGELSGSNVSLPLGREKAFVEKFAIEADGHDMQIRSAELRLGKSHVEASGKISSAKDSLRVDMDVIGEQIDWQGLQHAFGFEPNQRQAESGAGMSIPAFEGIIRLKTNRFSFEDLDLTPLELTAAIGPSGTRLDIDHAVACGVHATGRVGLTGKETDLNLQLAVADAQLEPASVCVTGGNTNIKGTYSLKAEVTGRGDRERLLRSLTGSFEISARDGEFVRAPAADATFDYLNGTGDFKFAFPDLDKETFPYRLVRVKGSIEGELLVGDEIVVQSSGLEMTGQAKIDLAHKQVDGKGIVAVLKPVDEVISRVPVVGAVFGVSFLGIPVRVAGSLDRPQVTYLSPTDIGAELLNMPMRIFGIPSQMIRLFTPGGNAADKKTSTGKPQ